MMAVDYRIESAQETKAIIESEGGVCEAFHADVTNKAQVRAMTDARLAAFGRIDILHNNVGIGEVIDTVKLTEEECDHAIDTNMKSVFLTCKKVIRIMGEQQHGVITNVSSVGSIRVASFPLVAYSSSKAGLNQFTRSIAVAYAAEGIRANAILPGLMNTPLLRAQHGMIEYFGTEEEMIRARNAMSPTGKMGDAWDVAYASVFLASNEAKYINGVLLPVDGGMSCKTG